MSPKETAIQISADAPRRVDLLNEAFELLMQLDEQQVIDALRIAMGVTQISA